MAKYDLTNPSVVVPWDNLQIGDELECPYSGAAVPIDLPPGYWQFECWGAQAGTKAAGQQRGTGGYIRGIFVNDISKRLYLYTGGQGKRCNTASTGTTVAGGFNGGGDVQMVVANTSNDPITGGGASDIRVGVDSLYARVIVAAGGGGSSNCTGVKGTGGGFSGCGQNVNFLAYDATPTTPTDNYMSTPATLASYGRGRVASMNGSFGKGGKGICAYSGNYYCGAGGGGWYGGGGTSNTQTQASGGTSCDTYAAGGSSYAWCEPLRTFATKLSGWLLGKDSYLHDVYTIDGGTTNTDNPRKATASNPGTIITSGIKFKEPDGTEQMYGHIGNGFIRITKMNTFCIPGLYVKKNDKISFIKEIQLNV